MNKLLLSLFALLIPFQHVAGEEWRGLVPLHSTRADVARAFGECANAESECEFFLPNEEIIITLSTNEVCREGVPLHTVLMIERQLLDGTTFAALGLDKRRFKSFNPWYPGNTDYRAYIDEKSGLLLKSFRGEIFQINYIPSKNDRQVCPGYFRKPKEFVRVLAEHVPFVNVRCPETETFAGDKITIIADYAPTGERNRLMWESTGGRIVEGQHTKRIILDTSAVDGQIFTVTVVRDTGHHRMAASCAVRILRKVKN